MPTKSADESTIRLLLADHNEESSIANMYGFLAHEPLIQDDAFTRKYVVHGDGEYADDDIYDNTCEK